MSKKPMQHDKPTLHEYEEEAARAPASETLPVVVKPAPVVVASPLEQAAVILRKLAAAGGARLGTSHGAGLVDDAAAWLAMHDSGGSQ